MLNFAPLNQTRGFKPKPFVVIAGLTRNLPSDEDSSLHLGDGGCSSAMTLKS
jgi:hypothetical protein